MQLHHALCSISARFGVDLQQVAMLYANEALGANAAERCQQRAVELGSGQADSTIGTVVEDEDAEVQLELELAWLLGRPRRDPAGYWQMYKALASPEACYRALLKVAFAPEPEAEAGGASVRATRAGARRS